MPHQLSTLPLHNFPQSQCIQHAPREPLTRLEGPDTHIGQPMGDIALISQGMYLDNTGDYLKATSSNYESVVRKL